MMFPGFYMNRQDGSGKFIRATSFHEPGIKREKCRIITAKIRFKWAGSFHEVLNIYTYIFFAHNLIKHFENGFFRGRFLCKKSFVVAKGDVDVGSKQSLDNISVTLNQIFKLLILHYLYKNNDTMSFTS